MYTEGYVIARVFMISFSLIVIALSTAIPMYGYYRKGWKGVARGCLMQPVACVVVIGVVVLGAFLYKMASYQMEIKSAMAIVKSTEQGANSTDTLTWYLKTNEECLLESEEKSDRFDVIRLDSLKTGVSVEDRIVVRFDLENEKATATDYDNPAEVVDIDWDKVKAYFTGREMTKRQPPE